MSNQTVAPNQQGRDVMAVPGNVTSPLSVGCNRLIAQGAAPVLCSQDVLDRLGIVPTEVSKKDDHKIRFNSPEAQLIYDHILAGETDGEKLCASTGGRLYGSVDDARIKRLYSPAWQ